MLGDRKTVVLRGGAPWGFRLSGGGQTSIYVAKVRSRSKASLGGLAAGDTLLSVNGISSLQQSLREVNDIIDTIRDQLILEVQSTGSSRGVRLDSSSSIDTRENSPVRSIHRITPQAKPMDFSRYTPNRTTTNYSPFSSINNNNNNTSPIGNLYENQYQQNTNKNHFDFYERSNPNSSLNLFRTATITANSSAMPITTRAQHVQQFSPRQAASNNNYDTPRNYSSSLASGYLSDTNDLRRSSISLRPSSSIAQLQSHFVVNQQQPITNYQVKVSTNQNENNYYSDSEYVTSGPRYYKISRQVNSTSRRPSNVVLPIRSMTSKAYEPYTPVDPPSSESFRSQPIVVTPRLTVSPKLTVSTAEIGAELLKTPIVDKKRYADSSFFKTTHNTYPTINDQKTIARKIASILEGGDPTQKGSTKFEKQRQRAEKYTIERESSSSPYSPTTYRPLRPLQTTEYQPATTVKARIYSSSSPLPNCIKNSLEQAQYINPLRYVGAPEEFKQMHMQEHVTHTNVPPQAAMNLVSDLNSNRDRGAALFQRRRARSEKWIIDENNVKKPEYPTLNPTPTSNNKPWGHFTPPVRTSDEETTRASPVRVSIVTEPVQNVPRFSDFNAKPKAFGSWTSDHSRSQSPRAPVLDGRKVLNLNIEPSIREGIAESHTRNVAQSWSPPTNSKSYFNYPIENGQITSSNNQDGIQRVTQGQGRSNPGNNFNAFSASSPHFTDL